MRPSLAAAERAIAAAPPASGAVVMGTGIVSIGLSLEGFETLSRFLLVLAAAIWLVLAAVVGTLALGRPPLLLAAARSPAALTGIAASGVLGVRFELLGWGGEAAALLAVALGLWLLLVPYVLAHWQRPTVGVSLVLTVGTESIAALAAAFAVRDGEAWLAVASLACVALGLVFYVFVIASFPLRQLLVGRGDHWVSGGALAIAALACARTAKAAASIGSLHALAGALDTASLALWAAALAWLPPLLAAELVARRGAYDVRRWSTVFPLGMYAVCSFTVAEVTGIGGIGGFSRVWIWIAFAVWLVVFAAMLRRAGAVLRAAAVEPVREAG